jgi:hypothetical protein
VPLTQTLHHNRAYLAFPSDNPPAMYREFVTFPGAPETDHETIARLTVFSIRNCFGMTNFFLP